MRPLCLLFLLPFGVGCTGSNDRQSARVDCPDGEDCQRLRRGDRRQALRAPPAEPEETAAPEPAIDLPDPIVDAAGLPHFEPTATCASCHPMQHREWEGSTMHYAAGSPTFNAFELVAQRRAADGVGNFCVACHSPIGVARGELSDDPGDRTEIPAIHTLSPTSAEGVSCDFCHSVVAPDLAGSLEGDGIANAALHAVPTGTKAGPIEDPIESAFHQTAYDPYLSSSAFCGSCHDVRIPAPDVVTGESFLRLENLFTEWKNGPYATSDNPVGAPVSCQDCHMSLYPTAPPKTYPTVPIASVEDAPDRRHAIHAFTAVSQPLSDDTPYPDLFPSLQFPNGSSDLNDTFGFPLGQLERRTQMLEAACTIDLDETPSMVRASARTLPIRVTVENVGAGHRVPSGFSQERQMWIELIASDDEGELYRSGTLVDSAHPETGEMVPDGLLHDEALNDGHFSHDEDLGLSVFVEDGPDRNQRPGRQLGLVKFQNKFIHVDDRGRWHEVETPMEANHMDNSYSLDMLKPETFEYEIPLDRNLVGTVRVRARLRYRPMPAHFLRMLATEVPELVDEGMVDRNIIIDMAAVETTINVRPN